MIKHHWFAGLMLVSLVPAAKAGGLRGESQLDLAISPAAASDSVDVSLSSSGYRAYAAWTEVAVAPATTSEVYFARSDDGGKHWTTPQLMSSSSSIDDSKPRVAADGDQVAICWLHGSVTGTQDIQVVVSTDAGATFGAVQDVSGNLKNDAGDADGLRMKLLGQNIYLTFEDDASSPGGSEDIYVISSKDGGTTFSAPVRVNDSTAGTVDCDDPELATTGTSAFISWVDKRTGNDRIYFSRSTDSGATWATDKRLDRSGALADCGSPSLSVDGSIVQVVWVDDRNKLAIADQVFYVSSADAGVTFTLDKQLGSAAVGVDADDPRIAVIGTNVYTAWLDDRNGVGNDVMFSTSTDGGATFAAEFAVDPDAGTIHDLSPHLRVQGDTVVLAYLEESSTPLVQQAWISCSANRGAAGTFQRLKLSSGLPSTGDADGFDITITDARDVIGCWADDRAGVLNNDLYVNGQRFPNLTAIPNGKKVRFEMTDGSPADENMLLLVALSLTGTNSFELEPGLNACLDVDWFTLAWIDVSLLPFVTDNITGGMGSSLDIKLNKFSGWAVGVILDPVTLDFLATTDPVKFN